MPKYFALYPQLTYKSGKLQCLFDPPFAINVGSYNELLTDEFKCYNYENKYLKNKLENVQLVS